MKVNFTEEDEQNMLSCRSFWYHGEVKPFEEIRWGAVLFITLVAVVGGTLAAFLEDRRIIFVCLGIAIIGLPFFEMILKQSGIRDMCKQYFMDENGVFYEVVFSKAGTVVWNHPEMLSGHGSLEIVQEIDEQMYEDADRAKHLREGYYYVKLYKQGRLKWNVVTGGEAKVTPLVELKLTEKGDRDSRYCYIQDGKKKQIRIPNAYVGLPEAVNGLKRV